MDDRMAPADVEVRPWTEGCARQHHDEVWSAWLHGSVAVVHDAGRLLLLVPMAVVTPAAVVLALRLYRLGAVALLDSAGGFPQIPESGDILRGLIVP